MNLEGRFSNSYLCAAKIGVEALLIGVSYLTALGGGYGALRWMTEGQENAGSVICTQTMLDFRLRNFSGRNYLNTVTNMGYKDIRMRIANDGQRRTAEQYVIDAYKFIPEQDKPVIPIEIGQSLAKKVIVENEEPCRIIFSYDAPMN